MGGKFILYECEHRAKLFRVPVLNWYVLDFKVDTLRGVGEMFEGYIDQKNKFALFY